ncbi:MAG: nucleotide exchange factor GrpE [Candidatus Micrarchaeota archaeon]
MISISKHEEKLEPKLEEAAEQTVPVSDEKLIHLEDKVLRLQAEFDNHRKRSEKQHAELASVSKAALVAELLPVVEQFEMALQHEKTDSEFRKGVELIYKNLMATLKAAGLEEMHSTGRFDPYLHEAIKTEDGEDGKILAVVQKGYMFKGKILRHAKVIVGRKPEKKEEKREETEKE